MKNKHVVRDRPSHRPDGFREEVRGPDRLDVPLNEVMPSAAATFRPGIETILLQDAADGRPGDAADAELPEFAENPPVAPAGGLGHLDDQLADLFRLPRPSPFARLHARPALAQPAGKGSRVDDGDDLLDLRAEPHAELQELGPFCRSHFDPFGQLVAKHPVLGLQILDHLDEFFLGGPGQEQQEGMDEPLHVGTMRKSLVDLEVACL